MSLFSVLLELSLLLTSLASLTSVAAPPVQESPAASREMYETWLCPIHRDEQSTGPGSCPVDGTALVKRLLVPSYACPMHPSIDETSEGQCPICNMNLQLTTRELQWFCEAEPSKSSPVPGTCADGTPMIQRSVPMAHGDHNPKHGGYLFMAPDGYHHIEGTLSDEGLFRLYVYDDFTKPIDTHDFSARVEKESLQPASDGAFLELDLGAPESYPAEVVLHVRFPGSHEDESRFDFIFVDEAMKASAAQMQMALPEFRIPDDSDGIYEEILKRDERIKDLIRQGTWPDLYIPALEAKDLVLALREREGERFAVPARKMVRAAWLLDNWGDQGNRLKVEEAYLMFEAAVAALEDAHGR